MKKFLYILMSVAVVLTSCDLSEVQEDMLKYTISSKERTIIEIALNYLYNDYSETLPCEKTINDNKQVKIKETCTRTEVTTYVAGIKGNNIYIERKELYDTNEKPLNSYRIISLHENSKIDSAITRIEGNGYTRYYSVPFEKTVTHKKVREYNLESGYCNLIDYFFEDKLLWKDSVIYTSCGLPLKLYRSADTKELRLVYQCLYDELGRLIGINNMDQSGCKCDIKYKKSKTILQFTTYSGQYLKYSLFYDDDGRITKFIQPNEKTEYLRFDEYGNWVVCKNKRKIRWWCLIEENSCREILYYKD